MASVIRNGTTSVSRAAGLAEPAAVIFLALFVPVKLSNEVMLMHHCTLPGWLDADCCPCISFTTG